MRKNLGTILLCVFQFYCVLIGSSPPSFSTDGVNLQNMELKPSARPSPVLPQTGIDVLLQDGPTIDSLKGKKVGLLTNQSSLTSDFIPSAYALHALLGSSLSCLFAPEHGWSAFCGAGEEIGDAQESHTKLDVFSLYGPLFEKNLNVLQTVDVLIIDVQDIGVRCYTYAATCAKLLEYASLKRSPLEIIVCDRPNPLGRKVNGPLMESRHQSLVSHIDVPFQHGKTIGGLLETHNRSLDPPAQLSIIPCPSIFHPDLNLWIPPSPGLPDWNAVLLYPGLVFLEGTNVSEGRGTSSPFKCVAAPNLDFMKIVGMLNGLQESGVKARPFSFTPQSGKLSGRTCHGAQIHITDYQKVDGLRIGVFLLHALFQHYPLFEWSRPEGTYWIDALTGSAHLREAISKGETPEDVFAAWKAE